LETPILIVGAGPTGLVLALWLAHFDISFRIIDKDDGPGETSRAMGVQARTLEFYQQIGIAQEVISKGIIANAFNLRVLGDVKAVGRLHDMGKGLSPYPYMLTFPQDDHEKLLIEHLDKMGITIERKTELISFNQTASSVQATLKTPSGGTETVDATYLCGCDGARSTTRTNLKMDFHGGTYSQIFYVADAKATGDAANGDLQLCLSENDFCMVLPVRSTGNFRLIGVVPGGDDPQVKIAYKDVADAVIRDTHLKVEEVNWFSTYHVHHRVAKQFRVERIFLAGDAAHIHSPLGAQGMNTGIADAINLAWKLAAVLQKRAAPTVLDSYEIERKAFALLLVSTTDKMFQVMTMGGTLGKYWRTKIFPFIMSHIIRFDVVRRFFFKTISQIKINYRQSPLSQNVVGKLHGGDRLPWVDNGASDNYAALQSVDWQVHIYGEANKDFEKAVGDMGMPLKIFPGNERSEAAGLQKDAVYLVRPDGYLGFVYATQDAEKLKSYIAQHQIVLRK
jgi:2-polyprenyl-6-methoxyphenol hydroxylase-like FAD-dependent oxidoreductase